MADEKKRTSSELDAWRLAHEAGIEIVEIMQTHEAPPSAIRAVKTYRHYVESMLQKSGYGVVNV